MDSNPREGLDGTRFARAAADLLRDALGVADSVVSTHIKVLRGPGLVER